MLASTISVLALATTILCSPTPPIVSRDTSANFLLYAYANPNLSGWAIKNAHIGAATNAIEIQRPSAYESDTAFLSGNSSQITNNEAKLVFALESSCGSYELVVPSTPNGIVTQVTSQIGTGSAIFGLNTENVVSILGIGVGGFWACPTNVAGEEVFTLFFGVDVAPASLPSPDCQPLQLLAQIV